MDDAHLEKLRRFALMAGLALITYAMADITIESHVSAFGLSVNVGRPEWLPVALIVASLWGLFRFGYYGIILGSSPRRVRRDMLDRLYVELGDNPRPGSLIPGRRVRMYWGPTRFTSSPCHNNYERIRKEAADIEGLFPKFLGSRVATTILSNPTCDDDGREYTSFALSVVLPLPCRIGALIQDFDYALPVLLNFLALMLFAWRALGNLTK